MPLPPEMTTRRRPVVTHYWIDGMNRPLCTSHRKYWTGDHRTRFRARVTCRSCLRDLEIDRRVKAGEKLPLDYGYNQFIDEYDRRGWTEREVL